MNGDLTLWKRFTELITSHNNRIKDVIGIARELNCKTTDVLDMIKDFPVYYNKPYDPNVLKISYRKGGMLITKESVRTDHSDIDFSKWDEGTEKEFELPSLHLAKQKQRMAFGRCRERRSDTVYFKIKTSISVRTLKIKLIEKYLNE